jgi:hypothetical protein
MDVLQLPDEVLQAIAAHLPSGLRLGSFSLAHSRLQAAADYATQAEASFSHTFTMYPPQPEDVITRAWKSNNKEDPRNMPDRRQRCCSLLAWWLPTHGHHLTKLQLTNFNYHFVDLPLGLKELELRGCGSRWHNNDGRGLCDPFWSLYRGRSIMQDLTALTKLHLGACEHSYLTIMHLTALTNLQHFTFTHPKPEVKQDMDYYSDMDGYTYGRPEPVAVRADCCGKYKSFWGSETLKSLTKLTHLELRMLVDTNAYSVPNNALHHLMCLSKLQTLILPQVYMSAKLAADVGSLTGLTHLHLGVAGESYVPPGIDGNWDRLPWLQSLAGLHYLYLERLSVDLSQMHGHTQLASLHLQDVTFSPTQLLALLAGLTQLQHLHVKQADYPHLGRYQRRVAELGLDGIWPAPSAAYAGLTASSQLQEVLLANCRLPSGAWPHAFPSGRQLPQLYSLWFGCQHLEGATCTFCTSGAMMVTSAAGQLHGPQSLPVCCEHSVAGCCQHSAVGARPGPHSAAGQRAGQQPCGRTGLACIAAACPSLQRLWFKGCLCAEPVPLMGPGPWAMVA